MRANGFSHHYIVRRQYPTNNTGRRSVFYTERVPDISVNFHFRLYDDNDNNIIIAEQSVAAE